MQDLVKVNAQVCLLEAVMVLCLLQVVLMAEVRVVDHVDWRLSCLYCLDLFYAQGMLQAAEEVALVSLPLVEPMQSHSPFARLVSSPRMP